MKQKILKTLSIFLIILATLFSTFCAYFLIIPKNVSKFDDSAFPTFLGAKLANVEFTDLNDVISEGVGEYRLLGVKVKDVNITSLKTTKLYVGGMPFGLKFITNGLSVIGFDDEKTNSAYKAGIRLNDIIKKVNQKEISSIEDFEKVIQTKDILSLTVLRGSGEKEIKVTPSYSESEGKYTLGLILKNSGAGIGTVTYILPDGQYFGGLGHGICNADTGNIVDIKGGEILDVTISGVEKSKKGDPGELKGYFNSSKEGTLIKNTDCGVYGVFDSELSGGKLYDIGLKSEIKEGEATILTTLDNNSVGEYKIKISNIDRNAEGNKCFTVTITDENLIAKTGGIVQGMSGSPIIQNGKIVGAITHVLINDPTSGYGIFIENMLENM